MQSIKLNNNIKTRENHLLNGTGTAFIVYMKQINYLCYEIHFKQNKFKQLLDTVFNTKIIVRVI